MKTIKVILCMLAVTAMVLPAGLVRAEPSPRPEPTATPLVIKVVKLSKSPVVDGSATDWGSIPAVKIPVRPAYNNDPKARYGKGEALLKAGYFGDKVYFMVQWKDTTKNATHKSFIWDTEQERYRAGKDREDRFIFKFFIRGTYSTSPLAGWPSVSDIWHWKAYRSNSAGLAHDKSHIIAFTKIPKSKTYAASNGKTIWFARPSDKGDPLYESKRYTEKIEDVMPKYVVNASVTGSVADVKAKGVWGNGKWTLELARKFDTGDHESDVVFKKGSAVKGAIAIYDGVGDWHSSISDTLLFKFE